MDQYDTMNLNSERKKHAEELDVHKRALAGDAKAKAKLEAKELLAKVDARTLDLKTRASEGDSAAMATLRAMASGSTSTAAAPATRAASGGITRADVQRAEAAATMAERKRWADVFASDVSRGRERGCANVLAMPQGYSAATIINEARSSDAKARASSDSTWDKANAAAGRTGDPDQGKAAADSDPWAKAYARAGAQ